MWTGDITEVRKRLVQHRQRTPLGTRQFDPVGIGNDNRAFVEQTIADAEVFDSPWAEPGSQPGEDQ